MYQYQNVLIALYSFKQEHCNRYIETLHGDIIIIQKLELRSNSMTADRIKGQKIQRKAERKYSKQFGTLAWECVRTCYNVLESESFWEA